jgi:hypothetical protein
MNCLYLEIGFYLERDMIYLVYICIFLKIDTYKVNQVVIPWYPMY